MWCMGWRWWEIDIGIETRNTNLADTKNDKQTLKKPGCLDCRMKKNLNMNSTLTPNSSHIENYEMLTVLQIRIDIPLCEIIYEFHIFTSDNQFCLVRLTNWDF